MADWEVDSEQPASAASSGGQWEVASEKPAKSLTDRLSYAWENATPGGPLWMAREAARGIYGAVEGSKAAVAPQVGSDVEEAQRQLAEQQGPVRAFEAASILAPNPAPGGGLFAVPRGMDARLTPPPMPVPTPPPLPPEATAEAARAANVPRQIERPDVGVNLLHPNIPHELPPERSSLSAAGVGGALTELSPETLQYLRQKMMQQPYTANTLEDRLGEMSAHQFFGEITPSLETDMGGIAGHAGPGRHEVIGSVTQRANEARERQQVLFDSAFGQNENVPQLRRSIEVDREQAASPLYQQFRQTIIDPSPQLEAMMPRLRAAGALQAANRALAEEGLPATNGFMDAEANETRVPTAAAFDYAKQHLDRLISSAVESGDANSARRYTAMKADLDAALDAHPTAGRLWQLARQAYAGPTARIEAMRFGQRVLTGNVDADELPFLTAGYNDAQVQAMRVGMRSYLENLLNNRVQVSAEVFNKVLSPNSISKIRWAIGDEAADRLINGMQHEYTMRNAPNRIFGNSVTANRSQAMKEWNGGDQNVTGPDLMEMASKGAEALHKPVRTAIKTGVNKMLEANAEKRRAANEAKWQRIREEASRIYTLQGPERDAAARYLFGMPETNRASGGAVNAKEKAEKALPKDHRLGMRVPKGGSKCGNCRFLASPTTCGNKAFVKWNGGKAELPAPKDEYCCDLYEHRAEYARGGAVHNHNPTEPQKKAGNYAKTHRFFQGLDITLENLKGHSRSGVGKDGKRWSVKMPASYGYIKRTEGADGDHVDCYIGPNDKSDQVFVVDQKDAETGRFDEHKTLLGFNSEKEALATYKAGFSDGKGGDRLGHVHRMSMADFRKWLEKGDTSKPIKHHEAALRLAYLAKRERGHGSYDI